MNNHKRLKVALIGAGGWGRQHARVFQSREDVDLCAIVGRSAEKTKKRAAEFGANAYTDIARMLDREQPELVSLCLPNQEHFEPTLQIIRAGFPLLVEKPLVYDLKEADILMNEIGFRRHTAKNEGMTIPKRFYTSGPARITNH